MKNELRKWFAYGIRSRKELGDNNNFICPKLADFRAWAMRCLVLDGPKGKLP